MDFRVAIVKNKDGSTEVYFVGVEHWDDFDLILGLLQQENDCKILSNQELVYKRKAVLSKNGIEFQLMQDDLLGNYLFIDDDSAVPMLERLAHNVINSIKAKFDNLPK
jgi:hypothetical protein